MQFLTSIYSGLQMVAGFDGFVWDCREMLTENTRDEGDGDNVGLSAMREEFQDFGFTEEVLWGEVCEGV